MVIKLKASRGEGDLSPYKFPDGFFLIEDTREQKGLFYDGKNLRNSCKGYPVIRTKLDAGDYTIKGFETAFAIERKQVSDFYSYIGIERKRTTEKLESFRNIAIHGGFCALAIEASEEEIIGGSLYNNISPEVARQFLNSVRVRYGIHVYFNKKRDYLRRFILDSAIKFYSVRREA